MATAAEQLETHPHIETIRRYYQACTAGDVDGVAACCTEDVVHYFLAPGTKPVQGNEHLGRYWRKAVELIAAEWRVEHAIACDDEAVIEWSMQWTSGDDGSSTYGMARSGTCSSASSSLRSAPTTAMPRPRTLL